MLKVSGHCEYIDTLTLNGLALPPFLEPYGPRNCHGYEAHLSTEQSAACTHARVPRAHGDEEWSQGAGPPSRQGPQEAHPVTGSVTARPEARLTLPAQRRLRRKSDFEAAYAQGWRLGNGFFAMTAVGNNEGAPRLGLAVSVRNAGSSVQRNRLRRAIRESFRLHQHELPPVDLVVSARARARDAAPDELRASLASLWKKVAEQCATRSRS